jgi:hypothetical protein
LFSKSTRFALDGGIMKLPNIKVTMAIIVAEIIYGFNRRLKLMPLESIAIISEFDANLDVKKITAINTNSGLNRLA